MKRQIAALSLLALAAIHLATKQSVARLRKNADRYPLAQLELEPVGEEVVLTQPDGTRIRTLAAPGSGPTVVLAHGFCASLREWNVIWQLLHDEGYNLIAFDQRGHGKSTIGSAGLSAAALADDYKAVLDHFAVEQGILVGHSMGGFLALGFALKYPEVVQQRLRGLVLFASLAGDVMRGAPQNGLQIPLMKLGLIQKIAASETYGWLFARSVCGDDPSPAVMQAFLKVFLAQKHQTLVPLLAMLAQENYYPRLGEIKLPCVVVCGTKDQTTPVWHSQSLGSSIANARTIWVQNKGHLLNWEAPESLIEAVNSL
ncbi:MAG: alpha/beta hydrolase [Herpetosiphonaceae bacterium]|nr:alpha/beta hydrolase [Herpetosiphonaceae bacterium]